MQEWLIESECGPWKIANFTIGEAGAKMFNLQSILNGVGSRGVKPGTYTKLVHAQRGVVMSDTPAEMRDLWHYEHALKRFAPLATTDEKWVHIDGLGMGVTVMMALKLGYSVEVVELDIDVIALIEPQLRKLLSVCPSPASLTVIHANALEWRPPKGKFYHVVWHDIWDMLCTDDLAEHAILNRRYGRRTYWQGAWGHELLVCERRKENYW